MASYATQPLGGWRNEACAIPIAVPGVDLTGITVRAQVRLAPDSPGAALLDLEPTTDPAATGIRLVSVTTDAAGVKTSNLMLQVSKAGMQGLPFAGELGDAWVGAYALQIGGVTRMTGQFAALASPIDSDNAPANRPVGWGGAAGGALVDGVTLTIGDDGVTVALTGVDLITPLVEAANVSAQTARDAASAAAGSAGAASGFAGQAQVYLQQTIATASTAIASLLQLSALYPDVPTGLAATAEGKYFAVAGSGDIYSTTYQRVNGAAVQGQSLPSAVATKRIAAPVAITPGNGTDNAIAINSALNDPSVAVVLLPPGAISIATTIVAQSGRWLRGAGRGVTVITRTNANVTEAGYGPALIRMADGSVGVHVSDLTLVAPKTGNKVQGVHAFNSKNFLVERVETFNMGYAFWAQQFSQYGVFRQCASWNANVHFEATQAYDIRFDDIVSGDGDGDNPLGVEAVWHCLLASRRITFSRARHTGKGQPFLIVANDTNGDTQGGLIDDILYDDCYAVTTDGKIALMLSNYNNLPIGRVELRNCGADVAAGGVLANIALGTVRMSGGRWKSTSQENFDVAVGASLTWDNPDVTVTMADTTQAYGNFFNSGGPVRITGGTFSTNSPIIALGVGDFRASPGTRITRTGLDRIYDPAIGMPITYAFDADYAMTADQVVGNDAYYPTNGLPRLSITPTNGGRYRVRFRGLIQKTDANAYMRVYVDPAANIDWTKAYGFTRLQKADGTYQINDPGAGIRLAQVGDCTQNTVRQFEMDLTFASTGSQFDVMIGADATKMLAGAEVTIERLA